MDLRDLKVVDTECPHCHKQAALTVDVEGYNRWKRGELIQVALPALTADQREALITGVCPTCWDKMFPPDEEDF